MRIKEVGRGCSLGSFAIGDDSAYQGKALLTKAARWKDGGGMLEIKLWKILDATFI